MTTNLLRSDILLICCQHLLKFHPRHPVYRSSCQFLIIKCPRSARFQHLNDISKFHCHHDVRLQLPHLNVRIINNYGTYATFHGFVGASLVPGMCVWYLIGIVRVHAILQEKIICAEDKLLVIAMHCVADRGINEKTRKSGFSTTRKTTHNNEHFVAAADEIGDLGNVLVAFRGFYYVTRGRFLRFGFLSQCLRCWFWFLMVRFLLF